MKHPNPRFLSLTALMLVSLLLLSACGAASVQAAPLESPAAEAGPYIPAAEPERTPPPEASPDAQPQPQAHVEEGLPTAPSFLSALELLEGRMGYEGFTDEQKSACRAELFDKDGRRAMVLLYPVPSGAGMEEGSYFSVWMEMDSGVACLIEQQIDLSQRDGMHVDGVYIENIDGDFFCSWSAGCSGLSREVYYALDDPAAPAYELSYEATAIDYIDGIYVPREDCEFFYINGEAVDRQAYYSLRDTLIIGNRVVVLSSDFQAGGYPPQGKAFADFAPLCAALPAAGQTASESAPIPHGAGNLANGGIAAESERFSYYIVQPNRHFDTLIREDKDSGKIKSLISTQSVSSLNLRGEELYYCAYTFIGRYDPIYDRDEHLYSSRSGVFHLVVYGDRMYFEEEKALVSCDLQGGDRQVLFEGSDYGIPFCIVDDRIYFSDPQLMARGGICFGNLCVMELDGSGQTVLFSDAIVEDSYLFSDGEWLYFEGIYQSAPGVMLRCRPDGSELTELYPYGGNSFNFFDGKLYRGDSSGLFFLNEAMEWEELFSGHFSDISFVGDRLYYHDGPKTMRLALVGSTPQELLDH